MKIHNLKEINKTIINSKVFIDRNIYWFLFHLLYNILFDINQTKTKTVEEIYNLDNWIEIINSIYIKKKEEKINKKYDKKNFINIIKFIKTQNNKYVGEIIENILIIIFSFGFKTKKENSFGKYLYNNLSIIKKPKRYELAKWFIQNKFNKNVINFEDALKNDIYIEEKNRSELQNDPLFILLFQIYQEKNIEQKNYKKKFLNYLYGGLFDFKNGLNKNNFIKNEDNYEIYLDNEKNSSIGLIKALFISVYIYYQNKNSPLMKYIKKSCKRKDLEIIPFIYTLSEAFIKNEYSGIILAPSRIEQRIEQINLSKNYLRESGFIELSKVLLFNKNIKRIDLFNCIIKSSYINFLNIGLGLFDNYSVELLNLSVNYLKEDSSEYIAKIISHLKNLKSLNLSTNNLKGISSMLIILKNLFRQGKTNLENLNLNKCNLDDISFYELGELIKAKYCKLKKLYLNMNNIPSTVNFLKKLKKNRSLTDIYLNMSNIGNNDTDNIIRIISNTNIETLYLYKNKISDFSKCLRIIYRTIMIKKEEEKMNEIEESNLFNLNISDYDCYNKNKDKINLLIKGIEEMNLFCLDISHILYGNNPEKNKNFFLDENYKNSILLLTNILEENEKKYNLTLEEINNNEIDIKRLNGIENIELFEKFNSKILEIINHDKSIYPTFLSLMAKKLIFENEDIKKEIFNNNHQIDKEKYKKMHKNLVKYIHLKKAKKNIDELEKIKNNKKMVFL